MPATYIYSVWDCSPNQEPNQHYVVDVIKHPNHLAGDTTVGDTVWQSVE